MNAETSPNITIPDAYHLVGCVDEGPAYIAQGHNTEGVFCLKEGEIFGLVSISRLPYIHPGDVQRVWAIGKPPEDDKRLCFFRTLKNLVVVPSVGK